MQTQSSKKSRGSKSASRNVASGSSRSNFSGSTRSIQGIPSLNTIKQEALQALKDSASEKLEGFSAFLPEGAMDDVSEYAEQAVKWLRKNPGASTALAVLSGVAVGAIVRQALIGGNRSSSARQ